MKLVLIAYNEAIDDEVIEVLQQCGVEAYTKWTGVLGQGTSSGPHLGSHVWPKSNNVLATVLSEDTARTLMDRVRDLRSALGRDGVKTVLGLKAFLLPAEDVT